MDFAFRGVIDGQVQFAYGTRRVLIERWHPFRSFNPGDVRRTPPVAGAVLVAGSQAAAECGTSGEDSQADQPIDQECHGLYDGEIGGKDQGSQR